MKRRLRQPRCKFAVSLLSSRACLLRVLRHQSGPGGSVGVKAFRAEKPDIWLPPPHPAAAPGASGGWLEGARKAPLCPATLRTGAAGGASCYRPCQTWSHWIASAWAPATCSWRRRERAPGGGGDAAGAGLERQLPAAARPTQARPAPLASANQLRGDVGSYANLQRPRHSLIKAESRPRLPSIPLPSPAFPSPRFPALFLCCVNRSVF